MTYIDSIKIFQNCVSIFSDMFTIFASGIAIYLFFFKRQAISNVFKVLANYSLQITFVELNKKMDQLNDLNMMEKADASEFINLLSDIIGQMHGNKILRKQCAEILSKMEDVADNPKQLTEPRKRSLVSELRESLKHVCVENFDDLIGG